MTGWRCGEYSAERSGGGGGVRYILRLVSTRDKLKEEY